MQKAGFLTMRLVFDLCLIWLETLKTCFLMPRPQGYETFHAQPVCMIFKLLINIKISRNKENFRLKSSKQPFIVMMNVNELPLVLRC